MEQRESEIARGLRAGDANLWRELYDARAEAVWRFVARLMIPGSPDIGDVVQETFLAAARSAGRYDSSRGSLSGWLYGIARRQVALHYRRGRRDLPQPGVSAAAARFQAATASPDNASDPAEVAAAAELAAQVRTALTELPADYETVLTAKYVEGASVEQIAQSEAASIDAVRSRLARARKAFRRAIKKYVPDSLMFL